ncbi:MAG: Transcriptional regulator XRE [Planctomycetota bacterium]|nr:MAG: Transcriptional regulator XRE [Planctomycetota bacterium]
MIAYCEGESEHPPTHLIPALAKAFGVSADVLLGLDEPTGRGRVRDNPLWRRFMQIEKLGRGERKQIAQLLDKFIETVRLKRAQ